MRIACLFISGEEERRIVGQDSDKTQHDSAYLYDLNSTCSTRNSKYKDIHRAHFPKIRSPRVISADPHFVRHRAAEGNFCPMNVTTREADDFPGIPSLVFARLNLRGPDVRSFDLLGRY